jgi:hypothetical protein
LTGKTKQVVRQTLRKRRLTTIKELVITIEVSMVDAKDTYGSNGDST